MSNEADTHLVFCVDTKPKCYKTKVPSIHSHLLKLHSEVLPEAVTISSRSCATGSSTDGDSSTGGEKQKRRMRRLVLPGTDADTFSRYVRVDMCMHAAVYYTCISSTYRCIRCTQYMRPRSPDTGASP